MRALRPEAPRGERIRDGRPPVFEDDFDAPDLDASKWLAAYLPHWSALALTAPSYAIRDGALRLFVGPDQPPWCPEFDGEVRVSNLQTGHWSGPPGSPRGQHRFREGLVVREAVPPRRLFTMGFGRLEMRARARLGPRNLASLWLIGYEEEEAHAGEITLMEVFGTGVSEAGVEVGHGIKRIADPSLRDEFAAPLHPIGLDDWHVYALDRTPEGVRVLLDGAEIGRTRQAPTYPMQIMLNVYELPGEGARASPDAWFEIDYVRAWAAT